MPEPTPPPDAEPTRADALPRQLEQVAAAVAELRQHAGAAAHEALSACSGALTVVSAGLRGLENAIAAARTDLLARRRHELDALLSGLADGLTTLAEAARRLAADIGDRSRQFEAASGLAPARELVEHLRGIAQGMHQAVQELGSRLSTVATQARTTRQRAHTLAAQSLPPPPPQPRDAHTELWRRDAFDKRLEADVATAPFRGPWCLMLVGIDHLDEVTARSSALACDELLARIARMAAARIQRKCPTAFAADHHHGVFAAIVPGDRAVALDLAEGVRRGVATVHWTFTGQDTTTDLATTASIGLAPYRRGDSAATLLERATRALRDARYDGLVAAD